MTPAKAKSWTRPTPAQDAAHAFQTSAQDQSFENTKPFPDQTPLQYGHHPNSLQLTPASALRQDQPAQKANPENHRLETGQAQERAPQVRPEPLEPPISGRQNLEPILKSGPPETHLKEVSRQTQVLQLSKFYCQPVATQKPIPQKHQLPDRQKAQQH